MDNQAEHKARAPDDAAWRYRRIGESHRLSPDLFIRCSLRRCMHEILSRPFSRSLSFRDNYLAFDDFPTTLAAPADCLVRRARRRARALPCCGADRAPSPQGHFAAAPGSAHLHRARTTGPCGHRRPRTASIGRHLSLKPSRGCRGCHQMRSFRHALSSLREACPWRIGAMAAVERRRQRAHRVSASRPTVLGSDGWTGQIAWCDLLESRYVAVDDSTAGALATYAPPMHADPPGCITRRTVGGRAMRPERVADTHVTSCRLNSNDSADP